jgi:ribosomal protein S1
LKQLDPEGNPYRELSRMPPGTVLRGKVRMMHHNGITVDIGTNCVGELPLNPQTKSLSTGSEIEVQITSLEVNDQKMTLKLANDSPSAPIPPE